MAKSFWHRGMKTLTILSALVLIVGCLALSTRGIDMRTKEVFVIVDYDLVSAEFEARRTSSAFFSLRALIKCSWICQK